MAGFDSPIGSKKITSGQFREFSVPDESGFEQEIQMPQYPQNMVPLDAEGIKNLNARLRGEQVNQNLQQDSHQFSNDEELERQIREAKRLKMSGKQKISEGGKRRIDMLLGMTRMYREVKIDESNSFVFQTLKSSEFRKAAVEFAKFDGTVQLAFEMRRQLLARSLVQICGSPVEHFLGSDSLEIKLEFIDELDEPIALRLYDEYNILSNEAKQKYSIKNESEVKEVVEDLKK